MKWFRNPVFVTVYIILCLFVIVNLIKSNLELTGRQGFIRGRERKLAEVEKYNLELKERIVQTQQPDYIERQARNLLGLVLPGEVPVLVQKPEATTSSQINSENIPNWKAWWKLFF